MDEDEFLDDFNAALKLGEKIMEMADRLEPVDRVTPGAQAVWKFSIEGVEFNVQLSIRGREQNSATDQQTT